MSTAHPPPSGEADRLTRLLADAAGRHGHDVGEVWDELLAIEHEDDQVDREEVTVGAASDVEGARVAEPGRAHRDSAGPARSVIPPVLSRAGRHRGAAAPGPRMLTLPVALRGARVAVRPAAVGGLVLLLVLVVAVLGVRWWLVAQEARPQPIPPEGQPVPVASSAAGPPGTSEPSTPGTEGGGAGQADGATATRHAPTPSLLVHVAGEVEAPGVVEVPAGSRVLDAVEAAGGSTGRADLARLNLARPVQDGERVWVPAPGEEVPELVDPAGPVASGPGSAGAGGGQEALSIDLNAADQALLEELPGVGPSTAQAILAWREEHGEFSRVEELLEVSGIGEKTLERLRPHVTVR